MSTTAGGQLPDETVTTDGPDHTMTTDGPDHPEVPATADGPETLGEAAGPGADAPADEDAPEDEDEDEHSESGTDSGSADAPARHAAAPRQSFGLRVVGVLGELMITAGVLIGLFVVWQLWWTDVQAGRVQEETLAAQGWEPPAATAVPEAELPTGPPPVLGALPEGEAFGRLYVPRFGADYEVPIVSGVDKHSILDTGNIGHYPETAMPGDLGNFSLAAHRTTYSKPFNQIADLQVGDPIVVRTADTWYVYTVTESLIVMPSQVEAIAPVPGLLPGDEIPELTERFITLTSCHPMFSARERFITHGVFSYWMPVSAGTPQELLDPVAG